MLIVVQIALVLAVIIVSVALMRGGSNARHLAIRRMLLIVFAVVAVLSIFFPGMLSSVANFFGVGRGTDLVLYGTIVTVLVFMSTTYQRFRHMEISMTKLARRIAIDEVPRPDSQGVGGSLHMNRDE
jgi:small membrane protein